MKLEYLFMGYVIIVVGRFYLRAIRDEIHHWIENRQDQATRTGDDLPMRGLCLPAADSGFLHQNHKARSAFGQATTARAKSRPPSLRQPRRN